MGSKLKFWFRQGDENWLYKQIRPNTGEDWAEKVSEGLCGLLGLPHAQYELAIWNGVRGVVSKSFLPGGGSLVHGNEVLFQLAPDYPRKRKGSRSFYRVSQHTIDLVLKVVGSPRVRVPAEWDLQPGLEVATDLFCGYLMFDAWVGNTDRHHENWGLLVQPVSGGAEPYAIRLAPTFDHASSLACHIRDDEREERIQTKDMGRSIDLYVTRARSAFYANPGDQQPLTTLDAFREVARRRPHAAAAWLKRLASVPDETAEMLLHQIPGDRMTRAVEVFTSRFLKLNRARLLALGDPS